MRSAFLVAAFCGLAASNSLAAESQTNDKPSADAKSISLKIVKTFGPGGPIHGDEYRPGETVHWRAVAAGLMVNEEHDSDLAIKFEMLDAHDQPVTTLGSADQKYRSTLEAGRYVNTGFINVPFDAGGKEFRLSITLTDKLTEKTVQAKSTILVSTKKTPAPTNARFTSDVQGRTTQSGRFTVGDAVFLHFTANNLELADDDRLTCTVTFLHVDRSPLKRQPVKFTTTGEAAKAHGSGPIPVHFGFEADRTFKGFARVTVIRNDETENEFVDIPMEVLPPVGW